MKKKNSIEKDDIAYERKNFFVCSLRCRNRENIARNKETCECGNYRRN